MAPAPPIGVRRGEVIAALSIATDLAMGQTVEFALKSCVLATRIGRHLAVDADERAEIFYQSLLRYVGCNSETYIIAALFGDEIAFRRDFALIDMGAASEMAGLVFSYLRRANAGEGFVTWFGNVASGLLTSKATAARTLAGHCEVGERLAERLGLAASVRRNIGQLYERWDGTGIPRGLRGAAIGKAVRIVSFAQDAIVLEAAFGPAEALARLRSRRGTAYEPALVDLLDAQAASLMRDLAQTTWDEVLALEPGPHVPLTEAELDTACLAMADFSDLKCPHALGHSRAVAALAEAAARHCGLGEADAIALRRAGLLHDVGQVAVPARVWLKPGTFTEAEWEQVRLHPHWSERILAKSPGLAALGAIVGQHHERCDGSGYPRGLRPPLLTLQSSILAAAEAYQNKIEARPHRKALSPAAAADAVSALSRTGSLDADAVAAVLAVAGHARAARREILSGLTPREIEVLGAIARGLSMKAIARELGVSPKTVDNHAQRIYAKIGVTTRGGATLYAVEHGLLSPA